MPPVWLAWACQVVALVPAASYLGMATLPHRHLYQGTLVGGLSGLAFDPRADVFLALSDDRGEHSPARFYTLRVALTAGRLASDGVQLLDVTYLRRADGTLFPRGTLDPEAITLAPDGSLYIASEGVENAQPPVQPWIKRFDRASGRESATLRLPTKFQFTSDETGIRTNLGPEMLTATPSGRWLFAGMENALKQDGPRALGPFGSWCRWVRFDLTTQTADREFAYPLGPTLLGGVGLADAVAIDDRRVLTLERALDVTGRFHAWVYVVDSDSATDVSAWPSLANAKFVPLSKRLLVDFGKWPELPVDNLEGMALGPRLADGRRLLLLVSDDNFSPRQTTQFLAVAISLP